jgi:hypothetical protein
MAVSSDSKVTYQHLGEEEQQNSPGLRRKTETSAVAKRSGAEQRNTRRDEGEAEQRQPWLTVHGVVFRDDAVVHGNDGFATPWVGAEPSNQGGSATTMPSAQTA